MFTLAWSPVTRAQTTIDFATGSLNLSEGQTGSLEGFNFTLGGSGSGFANILYQGGGCDPACVSDGAYALAVYNGGTITIAPTAGGDFGVSSFETAGTFPGSARNVTELEVIGSPAGGGTVTEDFDVNPSAFATLDLSASFTDLSSIEFVGLEPSGGNSPEYQLADIEIPAPTPESSSMVLFGTGLLVIIWVMRKRLARPHQTAT